jgi:hypothetical protein
MVLVLSSLPKPSLPLSHTSSSQFTVIHAVYRTQFRYSQQQSLEVWVWQCDKYGRDEYHVASMIRFVLHTLPLNVN